jgi:hypothetical protein
MQCASSMVEHQRCFAIFVVYIIFSVNILRPVSLAFRQVFVSLSFFVRLCALWNLVIVSVPVMFGAILDVRFYAIFDVRFCAIFSRQNSQQSRVLEVSPNIKNVGSLVLTTIPKIDWLVLHGTRLDCKSLTPILLSSDSSGVASRPHELAQTVPPSTVQK